MRLINAEYLKMLILMMANMDKKNKEKKGEKALFEIINAIPTAFDPREAYEHMVKNTVIIRLADGSVAPMVPLHIVGETLLDLGVTMGVKE